MQSIKTLHAGTSLKFPGNIEESDNLRQVRGPNAPSHSLSMLKKGGGARLLLMFEKVAERAQEARWENPNFFQLMHWVFGFNVKNPISSNKNMVSFQHSALGSRHHHWQTLGPLPYNLNLFVVKPNKTEFCWTSDDWIFFLND